MPNSKQLSLILNKVERYIKEQIKKESMPRLGVNDDSSILDAQKDGEIIGRANLSEELLDMISDLRKEYNEK